MAVRRIALFLAALALAGCVATGDRDLPATLTGTPGPQATQRGPDGGEPWLIPSPIQGLLMRATVFRPAGQGPFPLALINHGSEQDANTRALAAMPAFPALTAWFVAHGYVVVVPERPGHGKTGGRYLEDQGACDAADYVAAGNGAADAIAAAMDYMTAQPFVRKGDVVVAGNSAGAWGALALAARRPAGIRAVIDFAGGRGGRDGNRAGRNCSPDRLVAAAGTFGKGAHVPSLWLYAENDTYFAPDLSARMAAAYRDAGGSAEYHLLPAVGSEGHGLIQVPAAWTPYLEAFLKAH